MKNYQLFFGLLIGLSALHLPVATAKTQQIIIDDSYSQESAREQQEQWNDTHSLRRKINTHNEKQFDKYDRVIDLRDACNKSFNVNAYWEPNTERCLDRRTGRSVTP